MAYSSHRWKRYGTAPFKCFYKEIQMDTVTDLLFMAGVSFIVVHELDAIYQHEWRFFFGATSLSDKAAYRLFTVLHVPLFIFIFWNLQDRSFQIGLDCFIIFHAGLHWALRNHRRVTFNNWFSRIWIYGGAILAATHLGLLLVIYQ